MLTDAQVTTILPVKDLDRAREFYEKKLGLSPVGMKEDGQFLFSCGGGALLALFPKEGGTKAEHMALSFQVQNIEAAIQALAQKGVIFDDYDLPGLKTENHICVLGA